MRAAPSTAAVLLAAALLTAPGTTTATATTSAPGCRDILFIGARGSGEQGPGRTSGWDPQPGDPLGLGPTVLDVYDELVLRLGSRRSVEAMSVDYPAEAVKGKDFLLHLDEYFLGLNAGIGFTRSALEAHAVSCPDQRFVLVGYSQGAMVMHRVLRELNSFPHGRTLLDRVDSVILVADGDRLAHDRGALIGTPHPGRQGIGLYHRSLSGSSLSPLPARYADRVLAICRRHDPVCDSSGLLIDLVHFPVHLGYPDRPEVHQAVRAAAAAVLSVPLPTPRSVEVPARAGVPVSTQLIANSSHGRRLSWGVLPPATLPEGLTLTEGGLLSGIPVGTPGGRTSIRVRAASANGRPRPWITAELVWTGDDIPIPFGSSGWRYRQVPFDAEPGFEDPAFDDSGWALGRAAFGSPTGCSFNNPDQVHTGWDLNTDLLLRRRFDLPVDAIGVRIRGTVDNVADVYVNGRAIGHVEDGDCRTGGIDLEVPAALLTRVGDVLAVRARDLGVADFLDLQLSYVRDVPAFPAATRRAS